MRGFPPVSGPMVLLSLLALLAGPGLAAVGEPAATAQEVTPPAVGDSLPELTLKTAEGKAFDLNAAVAGDPQQAGEEIPLMEDLPEKWKK